MKVFCMSEYVLKVKVVKYFYSFSGAARYEGISDLTSSHSLSNITLCTLVIMG